LSGNSGYGGARGRQPRVAGRALERRRISMRVLLLWLLGIPLPILIILLLFGVI
jgi:hypothetical protein